MIILITIAQGHFQESSQCSSTLARDFFGQGHYQETLNAQGQLQYEGEKNTRGGGGMTVDITLFLVSFS